VVSCLVRFVVACANGSLLQRSRFGEEITPRSFVAPDALLGFGGDDVVESLAGLPGSVAASCLQFCPYAGDVFAAGFSDGKLALYTVSSAEALTHWDVGLQPITWVHWSVTSPGVLYVVDNSPCVHVFNLLVSDKGPVASQFLDASLKDMTGIACSDVSRRGLKTLLAFASRTSGGVGVFSIACVVL
jgi:hypothetical protein